MARIGMPHIGLSGHLLPAARLGATLARQGHHVVAWAPERDRAGVQRDGVAFREHEPMSARRPFPSLVHFAAELAEATERCLGDLVEQMLAERIDLVVHDVHVPWGRVAADFLGLPRLVTNPLFPSEPVPVRGGGPPGSFFDESLRRAERARSMIGRRYGVDLGDWSETIRSDGETVLSFSTERILGDATLPPGWRCIGPLLDIDNPGWTRPAAPGRAMVYVAFGTFFSGRAEPFRLAIQALAAEPCDVLVSTGRGGLSAWDLRPLPANVEVREFVDTREVLSRAAVHVSHGGGSSVHESLAAGVPMILIPQGSDQPLWAGRVQSLGAGQIVDSDVESIRTGVRALLGSEDWSQRARALASHLRDYEATPGVEELVRRALAGAAA